MIDFIASKECNPNGQLEKINIPSDMAIIAIRTKLSNKNIENIDDNNALIICNQFDNILSIIELARSNLIYSSGNISKTTCKELYHTEDINAIELISGDFLLSSIIYYNASFDYLKVLLRYVYSSHKELTETYPREKVENEMNNLNLEKHWELALGSLITKMKHEAYFNWFKKNCRIPTGIKNVFKKLKGMNKNLRTKYQANQLKHGAFPHFKRSDPSNTTGLRIFESSEQCGRYDLGMYENQLRIDEVQNFLIDYHNSTAKLINEIIKDIDIQCQ